MSKISNDIQWMLLCNQLTYHATQIHRRIETMKQEELLGDFPCGKYGTNRRNIEGLIEHGY